MLWKKLTQKELSTENISKKRPAKRQKMAKHQLD